MQFLKKNFRKSCFYRKVGWVTKTGDLWGPRPPWLYGS